jgi:hypothetical protein
MEGCARCHGCRWVQTPFPTHAVGGSSRCVGEVGEVVVTLLHATCPSCHKKYAYKTVSKKLFAAKEFYQ